MRVLYVRKLSLYFLFKPESDTRLHVIYSLAQIPRLSIRSGNIIWSGTTKLCSCIIMVYRWLHKMWILLFADTSLNTLQLHCCECHLDSTAAEDVLYVAGWTMRKVLTITKPLLLLHIWLIHCIMQHQKYCMTVLVAVVYFQNRDI